MSKFNAMKNRLGVRSTGPVHSESRPSGRTHEGAPGYARDTRSELFLLGVTNMVGEDTFYERAGDRDERFRTLVHRIAVEDPDWLTRFARWLRTEAHLRSAPTVLAVEMVAARLRAGLTGGNRQVVDAVLRRADEPGELLAYWIGRYGKPLPKPIKRGVADAASRLYDERALVRYDSARRDFRFGDVLELTHARPKAAWQGDLFRHAVDRRHGRGNPIPESLRLLGERTRLLDLPASARRELLASDDAASVLESAGMSWESLAGWLNGPMDAVAWTAVLPSMGYMARLRNLRNFDEAGVSDEVAEKIAAELADPERVARSRQLPMRFLSAYRAAPSLRWAWALERALQASLANVPALPGRTLVLVDRSGSMFGPLSKRTGLNRADAAAVFGAALATRAEKADLVQFGTSSERVRFRSSESVLRVLERFGHMGGTNTAAAVRWHHFRHDRVVLVTDEQAWAGRNGKEPTRQVPDTVPVYTWNLAGYARGHGPSGLDNRHTFGGLTDAAFRIIPLIEAGRRADWPF